MRNTKSIRNSINISILGLSAVFWGILVLNPGDIMMGNHSQVLVMGHSHDSHHMMMSVNPISGLMIGWILMVLAMMLPKLISPIQYIYERSLKRRRFWSTMLFVLGYVAVWTVAGFIINGAILGLNLVMPTSYIPAFVIGSIALVWQFSPIKQRFLNRGHDHWPLAVFGRAANIDAIRFGMMHGIWCIGSGWALMMFPMLLHEGHTLAMFVVAFIMISEHLEHPRLPRWYLTLRLKLLRIIIAQTRIKLKQLLLA